MSAQYSKKSKVDMIQDLAHEINEKKTMPKTNSNPFAW
jgi:hypothetical protein